MPQPTKEQFDTAAQKVMKTAPGGLSREQFFSLIDKELAGGYQTDEGTRDAITRSIARSSGGIVPTQATKDELGNDTNSTVGPGVIRNFLSNTVRNPTLQGAAHPTSTGDLLPLALPSAMAGTGEVSVPSILRGMKRVVTEGAKDAANGPAITSPLRFVQGAYREINTPPRPAIDRYMPNVSSAEPGEMIAHDRIAYGAPSEKAPVGFTGRPGQVVGKAPTLEDALTNALDEIRAGDEAPSMVSSHPSTVDTAGEGALKQSGKFGKSGSLGQPGGHTSGRPPVSETRMGEILNKLGGRGEPTPGEVSSPTPVESAAPAAETVETPRSAQDIFRDTTPDEEWHSGADPGSPEARRAQGQHKDFGEADATFKRKMADPLASVLASLLAEESMRKLMSSHGDTR